MSLNNKQLQNRMVKLNNKFLNYLTNNDLFNCKMCLMSMQIALERYDGDEDISKLSECVDTLKISFYSKVKTSEEDTLCP